MLVDMAKKKTTTWTPAAIKKLRDALGLTQAEAAVKVSVGQGVWAAWERGIRNPSRQSQMLLDHLQAEFDKKKQ